MPPSFEAALQRKIKQVQDATDFISGAAEAGALITKLQEAVTSLAQIRRGFLRLAEANNWTMEEIAEALDITRSRVEQILNKK
jgi:DNA-directed RNA polymerase specialized sigma24 family protein